MKRHTIYILILTILIQVSCSQDNKTSKNVISLGNRSLNILRHVNNNDSLKYKNEFPETIEEFKTIIYDSAYNYKHKDQINSLTQQYLDSIIYKNYNRVKDQIIKMNINFDEVKYLSETHSSSERTNRSPQLTYVDIIFSDKKHTYEMRFAYTKLNNKFILYRPYENSLNNASKIVYNHLDWNEKLGDQFIINRKVDETKDKFRKRVYESILTNIVPLSNFEIGASGLKYYSENPRYFHSVKEVYFNLTLQKIRMESSLIGLNPSASSKDLILISLEVFDENGINIINQVKKTSVYNDGSGDWTYPEFEDYKMGNRNLYEEITIILKINNKIIFSRKDNWANFIYGSSNHERIGNKYIFDMFYGEIEDSKENRENKTKRKEEYKFELNY